MPTFRVTSPEGKTYQINAPEGATKEQALARLKSKLSQPAEEAPVEATPEQAVPDDRGMIEKGVDYVKDRFSSDRIKQNVERNTEAIKENTELAVRSTADLPLGVAGAGLDLAEKAGFSNDTTKEVSRAIAEETGKTDDLAKEAGISGSVVRGVTQGLQTAAIGTPKWVSEGGNALLKLGKTAVWGSAMGTGAGALQPRAEKDIDARMEGRANSAAVGGAVGFVLPAALQGTIMGGKAIRNRFTQSGAEQEIAGALSDDLAKPTASMTKDQAVKKLQTGIARDKAISYDIPGPEYKRTTNEILDIAELDKFNKEANEIGSGKQIGGVAEREELLKNQMQRNDVTRRSAVEMMQNKDATTENIEATARDFLDTGVDKLNNVYDDTLDQIVKANPKMTNIEANEVTGKYISNIYKGFQEKITKAYDEVSGVNAQATPAVQAIKKAAAANEALATRMETKESLSKLLNAKSPSQITDIKDVVQAKAELESLIKQRDRAGDDVGYTALVKTKNAVSDFLDNHPNEDIANAIRQADDLYKDYKTALRRGGFNEPGVGQKIEGFRKGTNTVVNESQLRGNFIAEGADAPIEPVRDLKRLAEAGEEKLGVANTLPQQNRDYLYADLKSTLKEGKAEGNIESWFKKHSAVFQEYPDLQKEFRKLTDEKIQGNPLFKVANQYQYKDAGKAFKSILTSPEEAQTVINLAKYDASGKSIKDLRDQFSQYAKDLLIADADKIKNTSTFGKYFVDGTTPNKVVKEIFADDQDSYLRWKMISDMVSEGGKNRTLMPDATRANSRGFQVAEDALEVGGSMASGQSVAKSNIIMNIWDRLSKTGQNKVIHKMTTDPEYALKLLKMDTDGKSIADSLSKIAGERTAVPAASMASPVAQDDEKKAEPKRTPKEVREMERKEAIKPQSKLQDKYKSDPIRKPVVAEIERKAAEKGIPVSLALSFANAESDLGANATKNPKSTARGVFQLIEGTAKDMAKKAGKAKYNVDKLEDNVELGLTYIKENMDRYTKRYKKQPKDAEVYAMHVLGFGGFNDIKSASEDPKYAKIPATSIKGEDGKLKFAKAAEANKNFFYTKDGKKLSARQVLAKIEDKYESKKVMVD